MIYVGTNTVASLVSMGAEAQKSILSQMLLKFNESSAFGL